jgi:hypothetical protein
MVRDAKQPNFIKYGNITKRDFFALPLHVFVNNSKRVWKMLVFNLIKKISRLLRR